MEAAHKVATPTVALTVVHRVAAIPTNDSTSVTRRSLTSNAGSRRSAHVAETASSALPVAMKKAVHNGASVAAFATNAPSQTAGQSRRPQRSRAAHAMPVGAHT